MHPIESGLVNVGHNTRDCPTHPERPEPSPACLGQPELYVDHLFQNHQTMGSFRQRNIIFEVLLPEITASKIVDINIVI